MKTFALLIEAELEEALDSGKSDAEISRLIRDAFIDLVAHDRNENPGDAILRIFRERHKEVYLSGWLVDAIERSDACPGDKDPDKTRRGLRLRNGIFDLAGLMGGAMSDPDRQKLVTSLEKVWSRHEAWRRLSGRVEKKFNLDNWVDPATTAEESLLSLKNKGHLEIRAHLKEIHDLGEDYPGPMRDYCFYSYLHYLSGRCSIQNDITELHPQKWIGATGFVFEKVAAEWFADNRFLLSYASVAMKQRAGDKWPDLAKMLFSYVKDRIARNQVQTLIEALGAPEVFPRASSVEELRNSYNNRNRFSVNNTSDIRMSIDDKWRMAS